MNSLQYLLLLLRMLRLRCIESLLCMLQLLHMEGWQHVLRLLRLLVLQCVQGQLQLRLLCMGCLLRLLCLLTVGCFQQRCQHRLGCFDLIRAGQTGGLQRSRQQADDFLPRGVGSNRR